MSNTAVAELIRPEEAGVRNQAKQKNEKYPMRILLVEDEESDIMLTEIALDAANMNYDLQTLQNGAEVLPYLQRQGKFTDEPTPDVVLLDLGLPSKDGFEILADLAQQSARFGEVPIIILTGDTHSAFLKRSYGLNIAAYLTKPCSVEKIQDAMAAIRRK